jgi:uncharacterized protein
MSAGGKEQAHTAEPAWRAVCIAAAQEQSLQEGRRMWHVGEDEPLPFNYRFEHVSQVTALALRLGRALKADLEVVEAAGWLHDVRKEQPSHGVAGAAAARTILAETDFPPGKIEAVADAIRKHVGLYRESGAPPLEPTEAAVLWDADKLTKLGAKAIMVSLSTPHVYGKDMAERWRYVAKFAHDVLLRTVQSMNTRPGRRMAERRYRNMLAVLSLWAREAQEAGVDLQGESNFEISFDYDGLSEE